MVSQASKCFLSMFWNAYAIPVATVSPLLTRNSLSFKSFKQLPTVVHTPSGTRNGLVPKNGCTDELVVLNLKFLTFNRIVTHFPIRLIIFENVPCFSDMHCYF